MVVDEAKWTHTSHLILISELPLDFSRTRRRGKKCKRSQFTKMLIRNARNINRFWYDEMSREKIELECDKKSSQKKFCEHKKICIFKIRRQRLAKFSAINAPDKLFSMLIFLVRQNIKSRWRLPSRLELVKNIRAGVEMICYGAATCSESEREVVNLAKLSGLFREWLLDEKR